MCGVGAVSEVTVFVCRAACQIATRSILSQQLVTISLIDGTVRDCMYDRILVPTDGSDHAERAFDNALELADQSDSALSLLHVVDTGRIGEPALSSAELVVGQREDDGTAMLKRLAQRARDRGLETDIRNCHGEPSREIRDYADEIDADLVVMGYQGHDHDRTLGTVTTQIVKACERPVMLL